MKISCSVGIAAVALLIVPALVAADDGSVAVTDDWRSLRVNPAALSFGQASGLTIGGSHSIVDDDIIGFDATLALPWVGYSLEYFDAPSQVRHTVALSVNPVSWLHLGANYSLDSPSDDDFAAGVLVRPLPFLSLGGTAGLRDMETFVSRFGIGFRPLALFNEAIGHRVTAGVDSGYDDRGIWAPRVTLAVEPLEGISIEGAYDGERQNWEVGVSVAISHTRSGASLHLRDTTRLSHGRLSSHISPKRYRSILFEEQERFIDYRPGPEIVDQRTIPRDSFFAVLDAKQEIATVIEEIETLRDDPTVNGILFREHDLDASYSTLLEVEAALLDFRAAGKKVVFYNHSYSHLNYALAASTADAIYLHPRGDVTMAGFSTTRFYLAELLGELGIESGYFPSHAYKTYGNRFSESGMTAEQREALDALLHDYFDQMREMVVVGRGEKLTDSFEQLLHTQPLWIAEEAISDGLVDGLLYDDELKETLSRDFGSAIERVDFSQRLPRPWSAPIVSKVAVIYVSGTIAHGESARGRISGDAGLRAALRRASKDDRVKGILLRVDSGGGSLRAANAILREVELAATRKPLVVSMGGAAASAAYKISSPAAIIVAWPVTVTGSIGVFTFYPNIEKLSEDIGIDWDRVKRGRWSDFGHFSRRLTAEEEEVIRQRIDGHYQVFIADIARHRSMSVEEVDALAQGRVWSGRRALEHGLVDRQGGLRVATEALADLIDTDRPIEIIDYGDSDPSVNTIVRSLLSWAGIEPTNLLGAEAAYLLREAQGTMSWEELLERWEPGEPLSLIHYPLR